MGNYIRPLSDVVFSIASDNLWIEDSAIQQLYTTAKLTGMKRVIGMPDLHPGRGYPIGAAFFSRGRFYPALVGNDIGCGMALWQTDILGRKYNADKLEKRLASLPDVADAQWLEENVPAAMQHHSWRSALGSIGGGNHFAELQQVDRIVDANSFALSGLQKRSYYCWYTVVHAVWGKLSCVVMWRRFRITVCRKIATMRAATLQNMTMRWHLPAVIAR